MSAKEKITLEYAKGLPIVKGMSGIARFPEKDKKHLLKVVDSLKGTENAEGETMASEKSVLQNIFADLSPVQFDHVHGAYRTMKNYYAKKDGKKSDDKKGDGKGKKSDAAKGDEEGKGDDTPPILKAITDGRYDDVLDDIIKAATDRKAAIAPPATEKIAA